MAETYNVWSKLAIKILSSWVSCPCLWAIYTYKSLNMFSKLLDQFRPDFIWGFLTKGYCQVVQRFCPELRKLWGWLLVYGIGSQVLPILFKWLSYDGFWPFFTARSDFCPSCYGNTGSMLHGICKYAENFIPLNKYADLRVYIPLF